MTQHVIAWDDIPARPAPGGVTKRHVVLEGVSLVTVAIPAGTEAARHSHDHEQIVQVISGSGTLTTEQGPCDFGPGSLFVFPTGTWHSARFDTETVLVETNVSAAGRR